MDRYLSQFDRVRFCRAQNLSPEQTAFALKCSLALVQEYLQIDEELEKARPSSTASASKGIEEGAGKAVQ